MIDKNKLNIAVKHYQKNGTAYIDKDLNKEEITYFYNKINKKNMIYKKQGNFHWFNIGRWFNVFFNKGVYVNGNKLIK